jgi:hypothetical protein
MFDLSKGKRLAWALFFWGVTASALAAAQDAQAPEPTPFKVTLAYRALQPGEVVHLNLVGKMDIEQAHARFQGKKYVLWKVSGSNRYLTLIGLDLGMQVGCYPLDIAVLLADGTLRSVRKEIRILGKEFPVKKLWVDEKFVTPPAEVLERIKTESALLGSIFALSRPEWLGEGSFIFPAAGEAVPNFGERRIFNNKPRSPHSGVDISSPLGTPVKAANAGQVVLADDLYYAGNTVIIDHGLGLFSFYCHFSAIDAKRGDWVNKGDIIGRVGATGRVTGPHLHWSIRLRNSRVDPFSLLALDLDLDRQ